VNAEQWASEYAARVLTNQRFPYQAMPLNAYLGWKSAEWEFGDVPRNKWALAGWLAYQIARAWHPHTWVTYSEGADVRSDGGKP